MTQTEKTFIDGVEKSGRSRRAHNPELAGSNPAPVINKTMFGGKTWG